MNQPSEYEMVDFVFGKFKKFLGLNATMKGKKDPSGKDPNTNSIPKKVPVHQDVDELPDKIDKYVKILK